MHIDELFLDNSYTFHVNVEYESSHYAAVLSLTPRRIELKIMGEISEDRGLRPPWGNLETLRCRDLNTSFLLVGLKAISGWTSTVERQPKHIGFFENVYEVQHVIYFAKGAGSKLAFYGVDIRSMTISNWVGYTSTQDKIMEVEHNRAALLEQPDLLKEFLVSIPNIGSIGVGYNLSFSYSLTEYKAGIAFPPSLTFGFASECGPAKAIELMEELYILFAFITGGELTIEKITFLYRTSGGRWASTPTVYYPRDKYPKREGRSVLFPLSLNLRSDQSELPEFPLAAFAKYFALDIRERRYFEKYVRYRRLNNIEERFLGYFRVLESLCFKERFYFDQQALQKLSDKAKPYLVKYFGDAKTVGSFLKRLPKFNASRYNTEKCIRDVFEAIPGDITKRWGLQKKDIGSICKLRNDISHANDYEVDDFLIQEMTGFIEILLIISLFDKLGVDLRKSESILHRYNEYSLVEPPRFEL